MLFNKNDRVKLRDGRVGVVTKAGGKGATRDAFDVKLDDGTEVEDLRGSELRIEKRRTNEERVAAMREARAKLYR